LAFGDVFRTSIDEERVGTVLRCGNEKTAIVRVAATIDQRGANNADARLLGGLQQYVALLVLSLCQDPQTGALHWKGSGMSVRVQLGFPGFAAGETGTLGEPVSHQLAQQIVWLIGWAYNDLGEEYYYWFPAEMVVDPFTGAMDYIPIT
jgi:hypothetical protein